MRITLNLASRPYVELRPLYQRLRVIIGVLAVLGLIFWYVQRTQYAKAQALQAQVDAIQASVTRMQNERVQREAEMRQPQNAAVLNQAQFLNGLFLKKAFSWTAVMIDLEHVLPAGVQVLNIDPVVAKDGHVSVRLRVLGPHDRGVDLIRNLEKSRRFLTPRLTAESANTSASSSNAGLQSTAASTDVNFDIVADYNPLPLKPITKKADTATETTPDAGASTTPHPSAKRRRRTTPPGATPMPRIVRPAPGTMTVPPPAGARR